MGWPPSRRSAAWLAVLLGVLLAPRPTGGQADELDELLDSVQAVVTQVAEEASREFRARFSTVPKCTCTPHACGSKFDKTDTCHVELGDAEICGSCKGQKLDFNSSFILTPELVDITDMKDDVKDSICTFHDMDRIFSSARDSFGIKAWTYLATANGVMRNWPGHAHERGDDVDPELADPRLDDCAKYDPRFRPWYSAATSGPKDVVLVIDTSGSMLTADGQLLGDLTTRWDTMKGAILALLETFSITDYINLVEFNSNVKVLNPGGMVQATSAEIDKLKEEVNSVFPEGGTDFRLGLGEAFDLLINSSNLALKEEEFVSSQCQKVILFMTDGEDCTTKGQPCAFETPEDTTPVDAVLDFVEMKQQELVEAGSQRAHIFPFSFGFEADDEIPKEMACAHEGVWGRILPEDDPLFDMHAYTAFLATKRGEAEVIWSRVYQDAFGLGDVVTAAKPIFSPMTSLGADGSLVGVVGHDVRLADIEAASPGFLSVIRRFITRGIQCIDTVFTGCELQILRGVDAECPERFDDADCYFFEETKDFYIAPKKPILPWAEAQKFCEDMGGILAEIDKPSEEDILAGLASNAGSWVGLRRDEESEEWVWQTSGEVVDGESEIWTFIKNLNDAEKECAALDRRGLRHSVHPEDCERPNRFICEFTKEQAPKECKGGNVTMVDKDYVYNVRPLSTCRLEEEAVLDAVRVSDAAKSLNNSQVLCPLGADKKSTFEIRCCDDCEL